MSTLSTPMRLLLVMPSEVLYGVEGPSASGWGSLVTWLPRLVLVAARIAICRA